MALRESLTHSKVRTASARAALVATCIALLASALASTSLGRIPRASGAPGIVPHDLIAQEGGTIQVMRAVGDRIWMGFGPRVVGLDPSDPAAPRMVGRSPVLRGSVRDLAIGSTEPNAVGGRPDVAWALLAGDEIVGIDIHDPTRPAVVGPVEHITNAAGIALVNDHLWVVADGGEIFGLDVSDPRTPRGSGRLTLNRISEVQHVGAIDGHVVVGTSGYGTPSTPVLHVIDVQNPLQPTAVGWLENPGPKDWTARDAYVSHGTVWLVGSYPDALLAADVSDPSSPTVLARLESDDYYIPVGLVVAGGRAYATGGDGGHNYFRTAVVDVSDRTAPRAFARRSLITRGIRCRGRNARDLQHEAQGLVDRLGARERLGHIGIQQDQVRALPEAIGVLAPLATFQQLCQIIFWPQLVAQLTRSPLTHRLVSPVASAVVR